MLGRDFPQGRVAGAVAALLQPHPALARFRLWVPPEASLPLLGFLAIVRGLSTDDRVCVEWSSVICGRLAHGRPLAAGDS
jgi:hypothetical protein